MPALADTATTGSVSPIVWSSPIRIAGGGWPWDRFSLVSIDVFGAWGGSGLGLVFVHGIGNRDGEAYRDRARYRDALFDRFLLARAAPGLCGRPVLDPVWGDLVPSPRWGNASLPEPGWETLGPMSESMDILAALDGPVVERAVTDVAAGDLRDAVDLMYSLADLRFRTDLEIEELADLAERLTAYARSVPAPSWVTGVRDDYDLLGELEFRTTTGDPGVSGMERLGPVGDTMRGAWRILRGGIDQFRSDNIGTPTRRAAAWGRRSLAKRTTLLVGDVLFYLARRGTPAQPGGIVSLVAGHLEQASQQRPVIVITHSMGASIVYDILTHFRPDLRVDLFVTVGSQVGLFQELSLFPATDPALPTAQHPKVPAVSSISRWINVVDPADILAFQAAPVFSGVTDLPYRSSALWAHSAYFRQPTFHDWLADRAREALS